MENKDTNYGNYDYSGNYTDPAVREYWTADGEEPERRAKNKEKRRKKSSARIAAMALCCSLAGGMIGAGSVALGTGLLASASSTAQTSSTILEGQRSTTALTATAVNTGEEMTASEIYAANVNSTVGITTQLTTNYFGYQTSSAAAGSGFILTSDGYIVTNYHVIEDAESITVTTYDDTTYEAQVVGYDESNDLAVLKVDAEDLTPVILGDSDQMNVGDEVVAIGNPLGELTFSLTSGAISALDREVTINNLAMNLIQTDCAINSGNSGGALFNMYGEVIGITNAKYSGSGSSDSASIDNIGFAIPINSVKSIVSSIIEKGYITKPYIGVSISDMSSEYEGFGLPAGAVVQSVTEGSPADKAGLQKNDIITAVNGQEISGSSELKKIVTNSAAGDVITLTVYRQGETIEVNVTVEEQQQAAIQDTAADTEQNTSGGAMQEYSGEMPQDNSGEMPQSGGVPFGGMQQGGSFGAGQFQP